MIISNNLLRLWLCFLAIAIWSTSCAFEENPSPTQFSKPHVISGATTAPTSTIPPTKIIIQPGDRVVSPAAPAPPLRYGFLPIVANRWTADMDCQISEDAVQEMKERVEVQGTMRKWQPITISFLGPSATESDSSPNPFLDYQLMVTLQGPSGGVYRVPGFFDGDGNGGGEGNVWRIRFVADEAGLWRYCTSFRKGSNIAISPDTRDGIPISFDGVGGIFEVGESDHEAPGFLKWGVLEYVGDHYLRFREGPYWIKGGTNSPENFLGFMGFDNTIDQGGAVQGFLHKYTLHAADWQPGDPDFVNERGDYNARPVIGALNYLGQNHVNSIYLLPMNLGGDGQETYPFLSPGGSPEDNRHYDISKLHQWGIVLEHAQRQGIAIQMVLNETEERNRNWLDDGELGIERKLFYRELIARFGHLLALKWNLSEENVFDTVHLAEFINYIQALDWAQHPITFHTPSNSFGQYEQVLGDNRFKATSFQYDGARAGEYVENWRTRSAASGWPWIIDMDENNPAGTGLAPWNADVLRKEILYDVYFSGGNIEWYAGYHEPPVGGDMRLEDFRTRESMWNYMWYARRFMEEHLPFWLMKPADELLTGESQAFGGGEVFALEGVVYAVYLPDASNGGQLVVDRQEPYILHWYNPRGGEFVGDKKGVVPDNNGTVELGVPPVDPGEDWVVMLESENQYGPELLHMTPYP